MRLRARLEGCWSRDMAEAPSETLPVPVATVSVARAAGDEIRIRVRKRTYGSRPPAYLWSRCRCRATRRKGTR